MNSSLHEVFKISWDAWACREVIFLIHPIRLPETLYARYYSSPFIQATVYSLSAEPAWIPACTCIFLPGILSTPLSCCHWFLCPLLTAQLFCRVVYTCSLSAYISYSFLNTLWSEFLPPIATEATLFKLIIGFHVTESGGYFQVSPYLTFK